MPALRRRLTVTVARGEPGPLPGAVLWYPEVRCGHLIDDFCAGANLFCSLEHLQRWVGDAAAGTVMTIDDVAAAGRNIWADVSDPVGTDTRSESRAR